MRRCRTCAKQTSDVHGRIGSMSWTRRDLLKTSAALGLAVPTAGYPFGLSAQEAAAPKMGGRAVVAMNAATETIDPHFSRSQAARNVLIASDETLATIDESGPRHLQRRS